MSRLVKVEKLYVTTGYVEVDCDDADTAYEIVSDQIHNGELSSSSIDWSDVQYVKESFKATGDVE